MIDLFQYVPFILFMPLISEFLEEYIDQKVPSRLWLNFLIPFILVLQLVSFDTIFSIFNVLFSLLSYYTVDIIINYGHYKTSIVFHHMITMFLILIACFYSLNLYIWYSPELNLLHYRCVKLILYNEVSTIFYNLRPILKLMERPQMERTVCSYLFYTSFLLFRMGPVYYIFTTYPFSFPLYIYSLLVMLNIYWVLVIVYNKLI